MNTDGRYYEYASTNIKHYAWGERTLLVQCSNRVSFLVKSYKKDVQAGSNARFTRAIRVNQLAIL